MTVISRLLVVGWMVGGLCAALLAITVPALVAYGVAVWWTGSGPHLHWLEVGLAWSIRIAGCVAIWVIAKRAAVVGGPEGPAARTIALGALVGIAVGIPVGDAVRDAWGLQIASAAGVPPESFLDDISTGVALACYTLAVFATTLVPRRRITVA